MHTNVLEKLVRFNDRDVQFALAHQISDGSRNDGGIIDPGSGLPAASHGGTAAYIASMTAALYSAKSSYYRSETVLAALDRALAFMLRRQHDDGTISLGSTNFNSPPDTAFVVNGIAQIYLLLSEGEWEAGKLQAEKAKLFLQRAVPAMLTGGGHTPNHRWVLVAALSWLHRIFDDERLLQRAEQWLAEGLDCTADGEWTERSNGIYNAVSNIMMIYASIWFKRPQLLEPVRRNLHMMAYMVHEDGEVVTDYSGRQDWGSQHNLSDYFLCYQWMAEHDRDPLFAAMFDLTAATMTHLGPVNNHALLGSLMFPCKQLEQVPRTALPDHYRKVFNTGYPVSEQLELMKQAGHHGIIQHSSMHTSFGAPVMRMKEGRQSATIMTHSPSFFSLRYGEAKLLAVSAATAFTPGIVPLEQFEETETGCRMQATMEKGYYGPLAAEHLPASAQQEISAWYLLPHHLRPQTHVQQHQLSVELVQGAGEWTIRLSSDQRYDVMTQIVLLFPKEAQLAGEELQAAGEHSWIWGGGALLCTSGSDCLQLSGGARQHEAMHMRNSLQQGGAQKVVINLVTPFVHELKISLLQI